MDAFRKEKANRKVSQARAGYRRACRDAALPMLLLDGPRPLTWVLLPVKRDVAHSADETGISRCQRGTRIGNWTSTMNRLGIAPAASLAGPNPALRLSRPSTEGYL